MIVVPPLLYLPFPPHPWTVPASHPLTHLQIAMAFVSVLHDGTQDDASGRALELALEVLLDIISALLENATLFVEPYIR